MRYYFHLHSKSDNLVDDTGVEVADLQQIRAEVIEALQEISRETPEVAEECKGWTLSVTDSSGTILYSLTLDDPKLIWRVGAFGSVYL